MDRSGWAVVVPSCRYDDLAAFERAWVPVIELTGARLLVIRDEPPWSGIPDCVPRRSDSIRAAGFHRAWDSGARWILSLDDDVRPVAAGGLDLFQEYEAAFERRWPVASCLDVAQFTDAGRRPDEGSAPDVVMRGYPGHVAGRPVAQWGLWTGMPDLAGQTQLDHPRVRVRCVSPVVLPVPVGAAVTTCAMNYAFDARYALWNWQLPVVEGSDGRRLFDRWGDIWSGLVLKRCADALGLPVLVNGRAVVRHERASDPVVNVAKEEPGHLPHLGLWHALDPEGDPSWSSDGPRAVPSVWLAVTTRLARHVARDRPEYLLPFLRDRDAWFDLFDRERGAWGS